MHRSCLAPHWGQAPKVVDGSNDGSNDGSGTTGGTPWELFGTPWRIFGTPRRVPTWYPLGCKEADHSKNSGSR